PEDILLVRLRDPGTPHRIWTHAEVKLRGFRSGGKLRLRLDPPPLILVAGDVMVDEYVIGDVERISPESPVPVLLAKNRHRRLGGAGNVVRNVVSMGGTVALFATVGADAGGEWFKRHCSEIGVDTFWLKSEASRPTTIKTRVVARNQQIVRIDEEYNGRISQDLERKVIDDIKAVSPQVKAVIVSDYGKGFLSDTILGSLFKSAHAEGAPSLVDPKGMDFSRYRGATYVTPNLREASLASGVEIKDKLTLERAGKILLDQTQAEGIVITRGKDGITLVTRDKSQDFPVKQVEIVDVTGAGDTVIATLALAVGSGLSIEEAVQMANLAASLVVARFGAASVTLEEMNNSLKNWSRVRKIVNRDEIERVVRNHRLQGQSIVFTNGCFDLFHVGHLDLLRKASTFGDILIVALNSNTSVQRIKSLQRPIVDEKDRLEIVSALNFVDYAVLFDEDTPYNLIRDIKPDVLVKGNDWKGQKVVGEDIVVNRGGKVQFVNMVPGVSTSSLIDRIVRGTNK
ncbi:MAG: bifunctional heptose 7-phosphate kinase/heptose 1-phosphate adenyltransferase, partial [Pseudomonadota bacterium]